MAPPFPPYPESFMHVTAELYIHASSAAVWQKLSLLDQWPRWNSEVLGVRWTEGKPWADGARFAIRHRTFLGLTTETTATVRMCVPGNAAVWESQGFGLTVVNSVNFKDVVGGAKLTATHTYHGPLVWLIQLSVARQQKLLETAMQALKGFVEGEPRGR
jgi:hypothetical protein